MQDFDQNSGNRRKWDKLRQLFGMIHASRYTDISDS